MSGELERILLHPSATLWGALQDEGITFTEREREAYALGKLAVLLELETHVRIIEEVSATITDDRLRFEVASALRTIQRSSHISPESRVDQSTRIDEWYEYLISRDGAYAVSAVSPDEPLASSDVDPQRSVPRLQDTDAPDPEDILSLELELDDLPE